MQSTSSVCLNAAQSLSSHNDDCNDVDDGDCNNRNKKKEMIVNRVLEVFFPPKDGLNDGVNENGNAMETDRAGMKLSFEGFLFSLRLMDYKVDKNKEMIYYHLIKAIKGKLLNGLYKYMESSDRIFADISLSVELMRDYLLQQSHPSALLLDEANILLDDCNKFLNKNGASATASSSIVAAVASSNSIVNSSQSEEDQHSKRIKYGVLDQSNLVKFSKSNIWKQSVDYYKKAGLKAFEGSIPWGVSSNPLIAQHIFSVILARFHSLASSDTLFIFDFGCGHCFLGYFIARMIHQTFKDREKFQRFKVILCDCHAKIWEEQSQIQEFQALIALGLLDFCILEETDDDKKSLHLGKLFTSGATIKGTNDFQHAIILANYFFDSLPHDVVRFKDKNPQIAMVDANRFGSLSLFCEYKFDSSDEQFSSQILSLRDSYGLLPFVFPTSSIRILQNFFSALPHLKSKTIIVGDMPIGDGGQIWKHDINKDFMNLKWARLGNNAVALGLDFNLFRTLLQSIGLSEMKPPSTLERFVISELDESFQIKVYSDTLLSLDDDTFRFVANDWERYLNLIPFLLKDVASMEALLCLANYDFSFLKSVWWQPGMQHISYDVIVRCAGNAFALGRTKWEKEIQLECARYLLVRKNMLYQAFEMVSSSPITKSTTLRKVSMIGALLYKIYNSDLPVRYSIKYLEFISMFRNYCKSLNRNTNIPTLRYWFKLMKSFET